jgi:hypothetical protein
MTIRIIPFRIKRDKLKWEFISFSLSLSLSGDVLAVEDVEAAVRSSEVRSFNLQGIASRSLSDVDIASLNTSRVAAVVRHLLISLTGDTQERQETELIRSIPMLHPSAVVSASTSTPSLSTGSISSSDVSIRKGNILRLRLVPFEISYSRVLRAAQAVLSSRQSISISISISDERNDNPSVSDSSSMSTLTSEAALVETLESHCSSRQGWPRRTSQKRSWQPLKRLSERWKMPMRKAVTTS